MIRKLLAVSLFLSASLLAQSTAPATSDTWKSLRFLVGSWEAKTTTANVQGTGIYSFQLDLRDHVLVRHAVNSSCKAPSDYDCEHSDILYIYEDAPGQPLKAIYFDNEGHVIRYSVSTPTATSVVLLSEETKTSPQFRLSYEFKEGVMTGKFQIKPPTSQAEFRTYLEWSGGRK